MVEINLIYKMKSGKKHEFLELINSLGIPQAVRNENGCIKYEFNVSEDKDEIYLNELWESNEALDSHKQQEHLKKLLELKNEYVIETVAVNN